MKDMEKSSRIERRIQYVGIVIALLALIVTVYFSVKADKLKEVTVSYFSKQALVALENAHAKAGLEVRLAGNSVGSPWLLSGKLENSGNTPIEERDIETPIRLTFEGGNLLSADLGSKRNPDIFAKTDVQGNTLVIHHKLLNPGDWIGFDLVFDGEPRIPAALAVRISGVETGNQKIIQPEKYQSHLSLVPVPRPALIMGLALLSLFFIAVGGAGAHELWGVFSCLFHRVRATQAAKKFSDISVSDLLAGFVPSSPRIRLVWAYIDMSNLGSQVDDVDSLEVMLERRLPQRIQEEISVPLSTLAAELRLQLRSQIKRALASRLYSALPSGLDRYHRDAFNSEDDSSRSVDQIIEKANRLVENPTTDVPLRHRFDSQDMVFGVVCVILTIAALVVLGGVWRTILSNW